MSRLKLLDALAQLTQLRAGRGVTHQSTTSPNPPL
jgi:hypothetical protein